VRIRSSIFLLILFAFLATAQKQLTVEEIFTNGIFYGNPLVGVKWFDGGKKFSFLKYDESSSTISLFEHDVETGKEKVLVSGNKLNLVAAGDEAEESFVIKNYEWSPDEKYILFTGLLPARSVKTGGTFYLYDLENDKFFLLAESEEEQVNAQFSPDGKKLGFVRGNNLFVIDIESEKETQLTFDGSEIILNGVFDWVYEEEFHIIQAWEWSPDANSIAFWRFDQSHVPLLKIARWDSLYFNFDEMYYPKAGSSNSIIQIGVVEINSGRTNWIDIGDEKDIYVPRIKFTTEPGKLSILRLNRSQNKLDLIFANIKTGESKIILSESDSAWISVSNDLTFLKDGKYFIWSSERDGYKHLYLYDYEGNLINQITSGNWEVDKEISVDENERKIFYSSNERGTIYKDIYSIGLSGKGKTLISKRLGNHEINMSPDCKYYIDKYSTANSLIETSLSLANGSEVRILRTPDMSFFDNYNFSPMEFLSFTATDGIELNGAIIKPYDFDESLKYPVLIYNYSGPGSQTVKDSWGGIDYLWHQLLAQKGYIIFIIDNRGTGGRGKAFKNLVYKNLGKWEVHDIIEGTKYLSNLPYVDSERIGIWGWSYGGYISALAIMKGAEYFKAAIAVAPVTHWKFYDTIYTERYMQTPELNPEGYEKSSPLNYVEDLKGNLLLVHGTSDDNVHFQNTIELVKELINANKQFDIIFYPDKKHGISGGNTQIHLFNKMTEFILNNL